MFLSIILFFLENRKSLICIRTVFKLSPPDPFLFYSFILSRMLFFSYSIFVSFLFFSSPSKVFETVDWSSSEFHFGLFSRPPSPSVASVFIIL